MGLAQFSLSNLTNSVAEPLTAGFLSWGYLLYWQGLDALQTADGLYEEYRDGQEVILAHPEVVQHLLVTRGILTIRDVDSTKPQISTRPTVDEGTTAPEVIPTPSILVQVDHGPDGGRMELGSRVREREAMVLVYGLARTAEEQRFLTDRLRVQWNGWAYLPVLDHDAGTRDLVANVDLEGVEITTATFPLGPESLAHEFTLHARLRYEA